MKLAIFHQGASTGGWAYLYLLAKALKEIDKDLELTLFCFCVPDDYKEYVKELEGLGVKIEKNKKVGVGHFKPKNKPIDFIRKFLFDLKYAPDNKFLNMVKSHDVLFYTWPYNIVPLPIDMKTFFIPHDFIYTHNFGTLPSAQYTKSTSEIIRKEHEKFLEKGKPIVSTNFIAQEFKNTFPNYKEKVDVVYLSTFSDTSKKSESEIRKTLEAYGIRGDYILSANNSCVHKNLGQIASAMYYVRQKYPGLKLILTGHGTEELVGTINSPYYIDFTRGESEDPHCRGFGIINNEDFQCIMQGAKMVISTSLCEAGSGSALDAWNAGVPMVMSNIPSFVQQANFLGTKSEFCNPRNNEDVARAILKLLDDPKTASENAKTSMDAMAKYTWYDVARKYLEVFRDEQRDEEKDLLAMQPCSLA